MSATILVDDLETYVSPYGTHGAIQRLQFVASMCNKPAQKPLKMEALRLSLDFLKRTTNTKSYAEAYNSLKELTEGSDVVIPQFDTVWIEATQKQTSMLKDAYETDLQSAKVTQSKDTMRACHTQLANFSMEQGDYANALKYMSKSREHGSDPSMVFSTCMTIIKLSALLRQYSDIQSYTSKAHHTPLKEDSDQSKICVAYGLYYMTSGKYKDAALHFANVKIQNLGLTFSDVICPQDVALYGVLCALASLDRNEVQSKLLDSPNFRECLDLVPQILDAALDFCSCKYADCLSTLERLREALTMDVHLHNEVPQILQLIRSKGMVQYFVPFLSVSLHSMAEAFNTNVEGIQAEVAELVRKRQLDAKIDSHKKVLHVRNSNQRKATFQNAMRVSQEVVETTQALVLRMNLLKHDFDVHLVRQKK